jgi:hypothetical protein
MKKLLLCCFILLMGWNQSSATHLMGGQVTSLNIGGLTYQITLTAYRDTLGIPMYTSASFHYENANGFNQVNTVPVSVPTVFGNGVEMYKYIDTITFPDSGTYNIWFEDCCRNCALLNMSNPCGESFHLYNDLYVSAINSSPEFLNPPITVAQLAVPFSYNPLPFDMDGDSIAWQLDTPLTSLSQYVAGYTLPPSDSLVPFSMDPVTGEITFLPNTLGNFEVSVLVKEYRNGVEIGEIRRDMQIIVVPSGNRPPNMSLVSTNAPYSGKNYDITPGTPFSFTVVASDPDNIAPALSAAGDAFLISNPAVFTTTTANGVTTGILSWSPTAAEARPLPYIIGLRVSDTFAPYVFQNDISLYLRVGNFAGIQQVNQNTGLQLFPNPVTANEINLNFKTVNAAPVSVEILNLAGQVVSRYDNTATGTGHHMITIRDLDLQQGMYLVRILQDGSQIDATKFSVR